MNENNIETRIADVHNREELEALLEVVPDCTVSDLKRLFEQLTGEETRSNNKPSLIKRVIAQIEHLLSDAEEENTTTDQELADESNDDEETETIDDDETIDASADDISANDDATPHEDDKKKPSTKPKKTRTRDSRLPPAGTILTREYKGTLHEVTVLDEGFIFNGEHFRSLSKIAKLIAGGTSWNGFLFFKRSLIEAPSGE